MALAAEGHLSAAKVKFSHVLFPILEPILLWSCLLYTSGEIKRVLFQLRVPRGERGGRYGVIVFEALPFTIPQGKVALGIRSGTLVFLTIPRTEEIKGTIDDVISSTDGKEFKVTFKNRCV